MPRSGLPARVTGTDPVTVVVEGDPSQTEIPAVPRAPYSPAESDVVTLLIRHPFAPQIEGKVG